MQAVLLPSKFLLGYNVTGIAILEVFSSATIEIFARLQLLHHSTYTNYRSATIEIFARLQRTLYAWRIDDMFCYHRNFC